MNQFVLDNKERIVVVSKHHSLEEISQLYQQGFKVYGENRVQELLTKIDNDLYDIHWHLIGHLQTNKAREAVLYCDLIHSVDSVKLAKVIDKEAKRIRKIQRILIQVNIAKEETKFGIDPLYLNDFLKECQGLQNIMIEGIMVIGPHTDNQDEIKNVFTKGRELYDSICTPYPNVCFKTLSMGMSNDYMIADKCGSTLFRLGRAMFNEE